jgi:hypothetical protein
MHSASAGGKQMQIRLEAAKEPNANGGTNNKKGRGKEEFIADNR